MAKILFAPAYWVLARLSFRAGYLLVAVLFLLPLAIALFAPWPRATVLQAAGLLALGALYALSALRSFMSLGIERLIRITDRIASGELVTSVAAHGQSGRHDASRLWDSVLKMNQSLTQIVQQVRTSAEAIAAGAHGMAEGNQQLAERTQEQAASLEETASGIEQLAASARQNADNCARATRLAGASREVATEAARRMQQAAVTMQEIDASARQVAEILSTVQGIAFQTNILALNAAIEAARAGHQGRGFAVVAGEVRSLAQRRADAARETQARVGQSASSVEKGRGHVQAAEATMAQVVGSVEEVTQVLAEIAHASRDQSSGVEEISRAITLVDTATQQNAGLVEEAAGSAEAFQREARQLVEVVGRFKTDRGAERGRVVALVKAAAEHLRRHGVERACADFCDRNGPFVRGEHYIVALDFGCRLLAFAPDPARVGNDDSNRCDADGRYFSRTTVQLAREHGSGWTDYRVLNPRTGRVEPKSMYFERVGEVVLGCGIYDGDQAASAAPAAALAAEPAWPRLGAAWRRRRPRLTPCRRTRSTGAAGPPPPPGRRRRCAAPAIPPKRRARTSRPASRAARRTPRRRPWRGRCRTGNPRDAGRCARRAAPAGPVRRPGAARAACARAGPAPVPGAARRSPWRRRAARAWNTRRPS